MTTFELVNRFLVLCKYLTCKMLLFHHSLKTLKKWEEAIYHTDVYAFCIPRQVCVFIVLLLCLLELLVVKNEVKLEKKQHVEKNKG